VKLRQQCSLVVSAVLFLSGALAVAAGPATASTTVPASAITNDQNASNGSLAFYDVAGTLITSGNDLNHLFTYAAASSSGRPGTNSAIAYFGFPDHMKADSTTWFENPATATTPFPDTAAPTPVRNLTTPVGAATGAGDADLASLLPKVTQDNTAGYDGILQVRVYDTGGGVARTAPFWASDIYYDAAAGTWQQVFPSSSVTVPGSPTGVTASAGDGQTTVSFTPPASSGGSAMTGYTVSSSPGGITATGTGSPISVTGLANGTSYTFTVHASNGVGFGAESAPSAPVTAGAPAAPTNVTAVAGDAEATVSFTISNTGGSTSGVLTYTVTSIPDGLTATGAGSPIKLTGLTNGRLYRFEVHAGNQFGTSPESTPSDAYMPTKPNDHGYPTGITARAGDMKAIVSFTVTNSGTVTTGPVSYTVTSQPGGITTEGANSPITITGLTNGTTYTFTATAIYADGARTTSSASNPVMPKAATATTLDPSRPSVPYGTKIRLTGRVTGVTGNVHVTLRIYRDHRAALDVTGIVAPNGAFSYVFTPSANATYRLMFPATTTQAGSASGSVRNVVTQKPLFDNITRSGRTLTITGRIAPAATGLLVTLGELRSTGFVRLASVRTLAGGRFLLRHTFTHGVHHLKLYVASSPYNAAGYSLVRDIRV
jgi:hypothetical protein